MADGLRATGHAVSVVELAGRFPLCDEATRDAACIAWERLAEDTRPVIDGLALPALTGMEDALRSRGAIGLIHHPTALETGINEDARAALREQERRLFRSLRRVIVTSQPTADRLAQEFGVDPAGIAVVEPGADDAPRSTGSADKGCEILSVGALVPRKGHDILLRALVRLFDLDWHLTIAGSAVRDPAHAEALRALAAELGIASRVRFAGEVPPRELDALWRRADLFALATWFEGYGMAVAEALKRGLPVAVTSGGAAASLVGPEAGAVCQPGDVEQLSKALRRLIFGRELRREMAEVAWRIGQGLPSWGTQAEAFAAAVAR
jgi:glycosyltransferase involved in cell wall biosynthesis